MTPLATKCLSCGLSDRAYCLWPIHHCIARALGVYDCLRFCPSQAVHRSIPSIAVHRPRDRRVSCNGSVQDVQIKARIPKNFHGVLYIYKMLERRKEPKQGSSRREITKTIEYGSLSSMRLRSLQISTLKPVCQLHSVQHFRLLLRRVCQRI